MERVMNTQQILEETVKILSMIELPVIQQDAISAVYGSIRNLQIVLKMMEDEKKAVENHGNADAE